MDAHRDGHPDGHSDRYAQSHAYAHDSNTHFHLDSNQHRNLYTVTDTNHSDSDAD